MSKLPAYSGPVRVGETIPAFHTTLADGHAFNDGDLKQGKSNVLLFFRGRW
jgi:peroxiredoxin